MNTLFIIVPLLLLVVATAVFNHKLTNSDIRVKLIYLACEIPAVIAIVLLVFMFGYIHAASTVILLLLLLFFSLLILYAFTIVYHDNFYEQLAVVGNGILFYIKVVLSFLLFMTIFRYQAVLIQVLLSVVFSGGIFALSLWLEPFIVRRVRTIYQSLTNFDRYEFVAVPLLFILSLIFLVNLPNQRIAQVLNLNNHILYLVFDTDIPNDINVNFEQEKEMQYVVDGMSVFARDYYYDEDYMYLYVDDDESSSLVSGRLLILDRDSGEVLYNELTLNQPSTSLSPEAYNVSESQEHFISFHGDVLLFASDGIYTIDGLSVSKISDISFVEAQYYYEDDSLFFLLPITNKEYEKYEYVDQSLVLVSTLDLDTLPYFNLQIVNYHLLYYAGSSYYYEDPANIYDGNDQAFLPDGHGDYIYHYNTIYEPSTELFYQFSYETTHHQVLRIYDKEGNLFGYFRHTALHTWFILNSYHIDTDIEYRIMNDQLTFMMVSNRMNTTTFTVYSMDYHDSSVNLPFYAHYSMTTLWIILIAIFIPYLNNDKFYIYVDYNSVLRKDNDEA